MKKSSPFRVVMAIARRTWTTLILANRSMEILAVSGPHAKGTRAAELIRLQQVDEEKGLKRSAKTVLN